MTGCWERGGLNGGHESIPGVLLSASHGCNPLFFSFYLFVWFYLYVTSSLVLSLFRSCVTEAEEHRWSSGLLDGQRFRTAELHQARQRSQSRHAGSAGPARSPGSDGFQVSVFMVYLNQA